MLNVDHLGQVFTNATIVKEMLQLRKNNGSILEPSCGAGAFFHQIDQCVGIEYDNQVCPSNAINMDFFDYDVGHKFDTIIGNPPYVKYREIYSETKNKLQMELFDERSNLYLFFIKKCIDHLNENGELIFIVPRDFIKASSSVNLNKYIYSQGTITHWQDFGDKILFPGFAPNCVVFRFQKGDFSRKTFTLHGEKTFLEMNGQLIFSSTDYIVKFSDLFFVKVGAASGADKIFTSEKGNMDFVYSGTRESGKTKRMFYNVADSSLLTYKDLLLKRKIFKVNENNWYKWGRSFFESQMPRIYVNNKTRKISPFFLHESNAYDGSVLAIFPKFPILSQQHLEKICETLNQVDWSELGFKCGGRYLFTQRSLEQSFLPDNFSEIAEFTKTY